MNLIENASIKQFTTFGIEAKARYFVIVSTVEELREALNQPQVQGMPLLILGGGSNLLFSRDFEGLVVKIELKGISAAAQNNESVLVTAAAGEDWDTFVNWCVERGYSGLENLSLIPGVVGTCPVQNIGAYGVEVKDTIERVEVLDLVSGEIQQLTNAECRFDYRDSIFKHSAKDRYVILSVTFKLLLRPIFHTRYGAISAELKSLNITELSIGAVRKAVISIRSRKLPDPKEMGNAGSFFKNPMISATQYNQLIAKWPDIVAYNLPDGHYKLAAGWLIEYCGWKGFRKGDAGVHVQQALVLVNFGNATGMEILDLAHEIQNSVREQFGVSLEMEVNLI